MHKRHRCNKNIYTTRFSLLLLEDGEVFLDDHSACRYLEPHTFTHRKVFGRIKVCTRGLFFVPLDLQLPILRFPYRCMSAEPVAECFLQAPLIFERIDESNDRSLVYVTFQTKQVIEMRERGTDHPYRYRDTTEGLDSTSSSDSLSNSSSSSLNGDRPAKYIFTLQHVAYEAFLASIHVLFEVSNLPRQMLIHSEEATLLAPILAPRMTDKFDSSLIIDYREKLLMTNGCVVDRIEPLLKFPGCLMLTNLRLYFQPAQLNNIFDPVSKWDYTSIDQVYKRRYLLQQIGLEIYLRNKDSIFFSFQSAKERDNFYALIISQPELQRCRRKDLQSMMQKWQNRELSNFEYLQFLNNASGRTCNDLTQYPVFPWILRDYTSSNLDLNDSDAYRDLSKPIGALNEERLKYLKARYDMMPYGEKAEGMPPPFLYGTHYSTPGYVLYFLVRKVPEYMLCLQGGKFDAPDRLFRSIKSTWDGCLSNHTDVKELIPEFFDTSLQADEWLQNIKHLDLGLTQSFDRVDDVELPPWAHGSPREFVRLNRAALESDYVSDHLHCWIDLIFGYKQQGDEALKANNLFYYLSYEGSVDLEAIDDPVQKRSLESQIQEFGQTPKQLFSSPHPSRNEGKGRVEVATLDLLLSPRILVPQVHRILNSVDNIVNFRPAHQKVMTASVFEEYTDSEDEMENVISCHDKRNCCWYSLNCFQSVCSRLPTVFNRLSTQLWGNHLTSGKPLKNWRWKFRLRSKYSLATTWSWKQTSSCRLHRGEVTSIILTKDNSSFFTTSKDKSLKLVSTQNTAVIRNVSGEYALSCCDLSPDESILFVGSWDNSVYMHSVSSGVVLDKVLAHSDGISAICVLQDRFFTSSWDSSIKLWRYTSQFIVTTPIRTFFDCEESVLCLDVSRDGRFGAAGTRNGSVFLFDLYAVILHHQVQASSSFGGGISSITFAQDNKSYVCVTVQNQLLQYNLRGELLWSMDIQTTGQVRSFDSDGTYAVGGTTSGKILFWKMHEHAGTEVVCEIPQAHDACITSLTVSTSGSVLVSGAVDGSINVWNLLKKAPLSQTKACNLSNRKVMFDYGSIQTSSSILPSFQTKKTSSYTNLYISNYTSQFAEAEYYLEY
ncbi:Lysosomal trafficking regulator LYST and related BEACH and WD40 repeat proteins [Plasmopara halstedii]|uniref:Lysosomal trafficking regulator LYST and related BEACH and WD40 repeat proteins n=1 Tax=Plasmopara halstedii TaxID=4781 RepID=A0A0P1AGW7_PLAHL|nr:Lysosomal trafficking regulator LYST and related BEACH and WD40 repeat proteins [Plasmopara halstedii]CEG40322.1 Lysosomal trafficking regulator LYST and related BEACH and WD40 repeat proteins [Plasmopara halstedii]|eukprot:XP_024576691.1 Lysosomal trafficking regulator LYST and related BEACH and WD40 repeat proteins [Plasmopara halstedii]